MTILITPALVALVGLVLFLAADGKPGEAGKIGFFVGLFWFVAALAHARWPL